jgi:general secretion pathway protein G
MQATLERLPEGRTKRGEDGGFTLIELLIVIVILGILAGIVVFAMQNLTGSSAQASCGADFKAVETAAEAYKAQVGIYPGGSPLPGGWSLNPTSSVASGYPANVGATPATQYTSAMEPILGTASNGPTNVGPWLKDPLYNPGHYSIVLSDDGQGAVQVADGAGNIVPTGCASVS